MPLCYLRMGDNSKKNRSRLRGPAGRRRKIRCSIYHPSHISHGHICDIRILIELKHTRLATAGRRKQMWPFGRRVVCCSCIVCVILLVQKNWRRPDAGRRHRFCPPMQRENPLVCKGKFRLFFSNKNSLLTIAYTQQHEKCDPRPSDVWISLAHIWWRALVWYY